MNLFAELKRRNVFRVAAAYLVLSWLLLQVVDVVVPILELSEGFSRGVLLLLALGFVPVLIVSWVYEMTPEGLRRESEIRPDQSIAAHTGRRLDLITIAMVVIGVAVVLLDRFVLAPAGDGPVLVEERAGESPTAPNASEPLPDSAATPERSIAVLPFVNMSDNPENEYFADGLSEELLNQLAQLPDLLVAGRTSSFTFKGRNEDLREIGSALGVANVLEGSVRRQGDQVRVTAQLIRVRDGFHLWSNTYDRMLADVFAIQDDIAENVARAMRIVLDAQARARMADVGVRNVDAFIAYQKGVELFVRAHGEAPLLETLAEGVRHLDQAIELVPEFGAAWWTKADYYGHQILAREVDEATRTEALETLREVLDAAYRHSDVRRRAFIDVDRVLFSDDWTTLRDRIDKALSMEGCPDPTWIEVANMLGYAEQMLAMWERFRRCEPLNLIAHIEVVATMALMGDLDAALARVLESRQIFGAHPWLSGWQQRLLTALGRYEEALALAPEIITDREFYGWGAELGPLAASGRIDEARAALARWVTTNGPVESIDVHAALGEREQANRLAAELDSRPAGPFRLLIQSYICLCGDAWDIDVTPRFKARIEQAGVPWPPPPVVRYPAMEGSIQ